LCTVKNLLSDFEILTVFFFRLQCSCIGQIAKNLTKSP
jgi:hypothetical protein